MSAEIKEIVVKVAGVVKPIAAAATHDGEMVFLRITCLKADSSPTWNATDAALCLYCSVSHTVVFGIDSNRISLTNRSLIFIFFSFIFSFKELGLTACSISETFLVIPWIHLVGLRGQIIFTTQGLYLTEQHSTAQKSVVKHPRLEWESNTCSSCPCARDQASDHAVTVIEPPFIIEIENYLHWPS